MASRALWALAALLAALATLRGGPGGVEGAEEADPFPNYLGEVDLNLAGSPSGGNAAGDATPADGGTDVPQPSGSVRKTLVSWYPRLFTLGGIASAEECDYLKGVASQGGLEREKGNSFDSFFLNSDDVVAQRIARRLATVTMMPLDYFGKVEVRKYGPSSSEALHSDLTPGIAPETIKYEDVDIAPRTIDRNQRALRIFLTLERDEAGGQMAFPAAMSRDWVGDDPSTEFKKLSRQSGWPSCETSKVSVHPDKTEAVLLHTIKTDGTFEETTGDYQICEVKKEMWTAIFTIYSFRPVYADDPTRGCMDDYDQCADWAARGECQKNIAFMVGEGGNRGQCMKSCNACGAA